MTLSRQHRLDDAGRDALRDAAPDIITAFRGPQNRKLSTRADLRWGTWGSLSLAIKGQKEGLWYDHENGRGGDAIEFIRQELHCSFPDALAYAEWFVSLTNRPTAKPRGAQPRN